MRKSRTALRAASLAVTVGAAMVVWSASALGVSASPAGGQGVPYTRGAAAPGGQAHLMLPVPAGGYLVGTVSVKLIDRTRANPWAASPPYRELMASIWYPPCTRDGTR